MIHLFEALSFLLAWGVYGGFLPDFEGLSSPSEASDSESDRVSGLRLSGRLHYLLQRPGKPVWHNAFVLPLCAAVLLRNVYGKAVCALVFYPALIAINYLMLDTGSRLFKLATGASYNGAMQYCFPATIISRNISSSNPLLITSQSGVRAVTGFESNSIFRYSSKSNSFKKASSGINNSSFLNMYGDIPIFSAPGIPFR